MCVCVFCCCNFVVVVILHCEFIRKLVDRWTSALKMRVMYAIIMLLKRMKYCIGLKKYIPHNVSYPLLMASGV